MRLRWLAAAAAIAVLLVGAMLVHASWLRARADASRGRDLALVRATGLGNLVLSSSARWLRHPSQAEPAAAIQDVPAGLDVDPAGMLIGPPRPILEAGAR